MEKLIKLNKCGLESDIFNESMSVECHCDKKRIEFIGHPVVEVCRNYYAELYHRFYHHEHNESNFMRKERQFNAICSVLKSIYVDAFGAYYDIMAPHGSFAKRFYGYYPLIDNYYVYNPHWADYHFAPQIYLPFTYKISFRAPLLDIFRWIITVGVREAIDITSHINFSDPDFGDGGYFGRDAFVRKIIRKTLCIITEELDEKSCKYKKAVLKPLMKRLQYMKTNEYNNDQLISIQLISSISELIQAMNRGEFLYGYKGQKKDIPFLGINY